jgi:predicted acyltransferase
MNIPDTETAPAGALSSGAGESETAARLMSLDVFRGFTMFWLLGGKAFVTALAAIGGLEWVRYQLTHSDWEGIRYYDVIWPSFMLMVGVSIPFSFARRSLTQTRSEIMRVAWRRALVLFLLGSLRESLSKNEPALIELSSALQPIAVAYLAASYLAGRSLRMQIGATVAILTGYTLLLAAVPAPGIPAGTYEMNRNLVTAVDQMVLGRAHPDGWGTVLSAIPTIATTMLGLLLGQVLRSTRTANAKLKVIVLTGLGCIAAGFALSPVVPIVMKLWTSSYGLVSAGWACLLFACFFWIIDVKQWRAGSFPLVVIGMNALAAYLLPTILPLRRTVGIFTKPLAQEAGSFGGVLSTGAALLAGWLILWWMFRRKIFLRG